MWASVTIAHGQPGKEDEALRIYQDSVIPAAKQRPGYRSFMALADRATGKVMTISTWATEADLHATETSGLYQEQLAKFAPLITAAPIREFYEVIFTD
jgi:heme-degrading monooxygenase HmoA